MPVDHGAGEQVDFGLAGRHSLVLPSGVLALSSIGEIKPYAIARRSVNH
jgi:hypothetical protein